MVIRIWGGILVRLNCLFQFDLKILIAYSSVVHIGLILRGIITFTNWGVNGRFFIIIGHGLCSSGLFCLTNSLYERVLSRRLLINKGMINFLPRLSIWWFLLCSRNISSPMSLNLIAEIRLINRVIYWRDLNYLLIFFYVYLELLIDLYYILLDNTGYFILEYLDFLEEQFVKKY